jgi:hypothetical protein
MLFLTVSCRVFSTLDTEVNTWFSAPPRTVRPLTDRSFAAPLLARLTLGFTGFVFERVYDVAHAVSTRRRTSSRSAVLLILPTAVTGSRSYTSSRSGSLNLAMRRSSLR